MGEQFKYDVFLSHSAKHKLIVRPVAEQLKKDGLRVWLDDWEIRPGDDIPARIEEGREDSRVLVLFMWANAFGSHWAHLKAGMFRSGDPLAKDRRFIPLQLDERHPDRRSPIAIALHRVAPAGLRAGACETVWDWPTAKRARKKSATVYHGEDVEGESHRVGRRSLASTSNEHEYR